MHCIVLHVILPNKGMGLLTDSRFVCAMNTDVSNTVLLRSYKAPYGDSDRLNNVQIWQAAGATSAAFSFFEEIQIPIAGYVETYRDGATGANNPVQFLWNEASEVFMRSEQRLEDNLDCLLSIGTGVPAITAFGQSLTSLGDSLVRLSTETEKTAQSFQRTHAPLSMSGHYCRLNVENGLQDVGLENAEKKNKIMAVTKEYLNAPDTFNRIQLCVEKLSEHECALAYA